MSSMVVCTADEKRRVEWDPEDAAAAAAVKAEFDGIIQRSFAYAVTETGEREQIHDFDPTAKEIVITAPLAGG